MLKKACLHTWHNCDLGTQYMIYMHAHLAQQVLFNINLPLVINEYVFSILFLDTVI